MHCVADCIIRRVIPQPTEWQHSVTIALGFWFQVYWSSAPLNPVGPRRTRICVDILCITSQVYLGVRSYPGDHLGPRVVHRSLDIPDPTPAETGLSDRPAHPDRDLVDKHYHDTAEPEMAYGTLTGRVAVRAFDPFACFTVVNGDSLGAPRTIKVDCHPQYPITLRRAP